MADFTRDEIANADAEERARLREMLAEVENEENEAKLEEKRAEVAELLAAYETAKAELAELEGDNRVRYSNPRPLNRYVHDALRDGKTTKDEIAQHVLDAGYKSGSSDFPNMVYQNLRAEVKENRVMKDGKAYAIVEDEVQKLEAAPADGDSE